jgi:transcriptional regulator with XRE-family HTH domain
MGWQKAEAAKEWQQLFGARVRELRQAAGVSQMQLAHAADLDPTYLSAVEQGRRNIGLVNICQIAKALSVPVRDLFPPEAPLADTTRP